MRGVQEVVQDAQLFVDQVTNPLLTIRLTSPGGVEDPQPDEAVRKVTIPHTSHFFTDVDCYVDQALEAIDQVTSPLLRK